MYDPVRNFNFSVEFLDAVHPETLEDIEHELKLSVASIILERVQKEVIIEFRYFEDHFVDIYECLSAQENLTIRLQVMSSKGEPLKEYDIEGLTIKRATMPFSYAPPAENSEVLTETLVIGYETINAAK